MHEELRGPLLEFRSGGIRRCSRVEMLGRSLGAAPVWLRPTLLPLFGVRRVSIAITEAVQWGSGGLEGLASNLQDVSPALLPRLLSNSN